MSVFWEYCLIIVSAFEMASMCEGKPKALMVSVYPCLHWARWLRKTRRPVFVGLMLNFPQHRKYVYLPFLQCKSVSLARLTAKRFQTASCRETSPVVVL